MSEDVHARFCERPWGQFPRSTHPLLVCHKSAKPALAAFEAIAQRMDLTLNRDKTRETRLTEGFDFLGIQFVKRKSPTSGKPAIYLFPAQSAQQTIRNKLKYLTSRRARVHQEPGEPRIASV